MAKVLIDEIIPALKAKMLTPPVETADIADEAVTAAKADVAGIMNYAGDNGQLFGLGGSALTGITDLNNTPTKTGFFMGQNLANIPTSGTWWYIQQIAHYGGESYMLQIACSLFDANVVYQRTKSNGTWQAWKRIMTSAAVLNQCYPVGSHFISYALDTPEKVAAALGGGTWIRSSEGRVMVGFTSSDGDFNSQGKTGGAKSVTLALNHMPPGVITSKSASLYNTKVDLAGGSYVPYCTDLKAQSAVSLLQPYITRYIYVRTV